jgi:hypothetical protein
MGNVMSYLMRFKQLIIGKELGHASPSKNTEVERIEIMYDEMAERIK